MATRNAPTATKETGGYLMAANPSNTSIGVGVVGGLLPMSITLGVGGTSLNAPTLMPIVAAPPGTSAGAASAAAMENRLLQQLQHQHIISASCSVNSASTKNSTSAKSSTMMPVVGLGGWAVATKPGMGGLGGRGGANAPITINDSGQIFGVFEENNRGDHQQVVSGSHDPNYLQPQTDNVGNNNPMMLQMGGAPLHPVAEFLFQLTKMLTENNNEFIEWRNASIFVHDPPGLEREILPKYFRHSNYSSFQRQMNYFGFRKIAGKGKMAPCSYVNEHAKEEISSLLFIKRKKTTISNAATKLMAQQNRINRSIARGDLGIAGNALGLINFNPLGGLGVNATSLPGGALSLSNFSLGGLPTGMGGAGTFQLSAPLTGQASFLNQQQNVGNFQLSAAQESSLTDQASLPNQQQNILAQLQQAHALAMTNSPGHGQGIENKMNCFNTNGVVNTGFLTTDQGNVFMNSGNHAIPDNGSNVAMYQPLQVQQAQPLQIQQETPTLGEKTYSDSDIRALINQQISMFNTPVSSEQFSWPAMITNDDPTALSCQAQPFQGDSSQQQQQQQGVLNSVVPTVSVPQDLQQIDWNDIFRQMGGYSGGFDPVGAPGSINLQQLLQSSNSGGIFGTVGGANGVSQCFQQSYQNPT